MRNKLLLVFGLVFAFNLQVFAQDVSIDYETELIERFKNDSISYDFIESLSVIDSSITKKDTQRFKERLSTIISSLPNKGSSKKKEQKRIKKIYDYVHDELFVKYEDIAYFPQIFDNGVYNCVTATAIYAYIFEAIDVPYYIKESPGHVYLIAYPETLKMHLETTAPGDYGFASIKDSDIKDVVKELVKMKIVSKQEVDQKGASKIYMDYFYGEEFLDKRSLIGMQYYNKSLSFYQNQDYTIALENIEKSLVFFPYVPSKYLKKSLSILTLATAEFNNLEVINNFYDTFSRLEYKQDYSRQDLNYYLYKIVEHDDNDLEFIISTITIFDKFEIAEIREHCLTFLEEYIIKKSIRNNDFDKALDFSNKLITLNENNKVAKEAINYVYESKFALLPYSDSSIKEIDNAIEAYPMLSKNIKITSIKAFITIRLIDQSYRSQKVDQGAKYLEMLEQIFEETEKDLLLNSEFIAYAYLAAGKYYYRLNSFTKAKKILQRGLNFAPDNKELKKHLKWTVEEMN